MTMRTLQFKIYRYDPDKDQKPYMQDIAVEVDATDRELLDALVKLKAKDDSIAFRRSCREGVCGSDAMNINGKNGLACLADLADFPAGKPIVLRPLPADAADVSLARLARLDGQTKGESVFDVGLEMRRTMQKHAGVFRFDNLLKEGVQKIGEVAERAKRTEIKDKSKVWNVARMEALELDNLIEVARATMVSAEARKESRGAHVRDDAPDTAENPNGRDDANWLKHTLWYSEGNRLDYKPVNLKPLSDDVEPIALAKRTY